ncbi:MAG: GNAT family N-acetyltransferase [Candidatus Methanomethylophilaceae archaeon]|nr:GNAT family N-acetyltransferase [Candidatus Methanomethylophilaceae archaeon]
MDYQFRMAERKDVGIILSFIRALAEYEGMSDQVVATEELLEEQMFDREKAKALFVMEDGKEVGFALYFCNFSTFRGRAGLYLEDLYVYPEYRGKGYGKALLSKLAQMAADSGCERMEWWCLDWNRPSIEFYKSLGAIPMDEWTVYRLTGDELRKFGSN